LPAEKVKNVLPTAMSTLPLLILAATVASFLPSPSPPQVVVHSLYLRRAHKGFIQRLWLEQPLGKSIRIEELAMEQLEPAEALFLSRAWQWNCGQEQKR